MNEKQKYVIDDLLRESYKKFNDELSSDENKDYRRGYYAGMAVSLSHLKALLLQEEIINEK